MAKIKVKIIYDRENCIGAGSCVVVFPKFWQMADDDEKANLINSASNTKTGKYELEVEVNEEDYARLKESADSCPVQVIKVIKVL